MSKGDTIFTIICSIFFGLFAFSIVINLEEPIVTTLSQILTILIVILIPIILFFTRKKKRVKKVESIEYKDVEKEEVKEVVKEDVDYSKYKLINDNNDRYKYKLPQKGLVKDNIILKDFILDSKMGELVLPLGTDEHHNRIFQDFKENPNLLIGGLPNSGKTSLINTLLYSLLFFNKPNSLRISIIDLTRVNYLHYEKLPHLIGPIIYEEALTFKYLNIVVAEINKRYPKLINDKVKDINEYNRRHANEMQKLLLVIDDLPLKKEYLDLIDIITDKGPEVGIYTILSVRNDIGDKNIDLLNYNFLYRLCFKVNNSSESMAILDEVGAEKLEFGKALLQTSTNPLAEVIDVVTASDEEINNMASIWEQKYINALEKEKPSVEKRKD